jgi:hypothetical protein
VANPPPKKKLNPEDIPGAPEWLGRFVEPLNLFIEATNVALDRGVTYAQNFAGEVKTITFTAQSEWTPITFNTGWTQFSSTQYPPCGVRKLMDGTVEARGLAKNTSPASTICAHPSGYAPAEGYRRILPNVATAAFAATVVTPSGLEYLTGTGTDWWSLDGLRWMAADNTPVRWGNPIEVKLGTPARPFSGRPGQVHVLGCRRNTQSATPVPVQGLDWSAAYVGKETLLRINKVWGLQEGVSYNLTLLVLPE